MMGTGTYQPYTVVRIPLLPIRINSPTHLHLRVQPLPIHRNHRQAKLLPHRRSQGSQHWRSEASARLSKEPRARLHPL